MKKVAIFGKPGSGKSRLAKRLAEQTGLPLHPTDSLIYDENGNPKDPTKYVHEHAELLASDQWIIDGFAPFTAINTFYERLNSADTLIYIDLPYWLSYWFVTKRLIKGLLGKTPEGWPEGSSIIQGSLASYQTLKLCPKFWNEGFWEKLQQMVEDDPQGKRLIRIRSKRELDGFVLEKQ